MKHVNRAFAIFMALCMIALGGAFAIEPFAQEDLSTLTLLFHYEDVILSGVKCKLYYVATYVYGEGLALAGDFVGLPIVLEMDGSHQSSALAQTLVAYAEAHAIAPHSEATSNEQGRITFSDLPPGLYLISSDNLIDGEAVYSFAPSLLVLPAEHEDGSMIFDMTAYAKCAAHDPSGEEITYRVIKHWDDEGFEEYRPQGIEIAVLCNGEPYLLATLTALNGWSFEWTVPDDGSVYRVVEVNLDGRYSVIITAEGTIFTMVNTYSGSFESPAPSTSADPSASPDPSTSPNASASPNPSATPGANPSATLPAEPSPTPRPALPQTGQLWWPVPLGAACGLTLILLGYVLNRRNYDRG